MIQLDANHLICGLIPSATESKNVGRWLSAGEQLATSSIAWMEFVTGPVTPALIEAVAQILEDRVVPVGREEAELAAQLFNAAGRKRSLRYDSLIAATAIRAQARLGTSNRADFSIFKSHGLILAE